MTKIFTCTALVSSLFAQAQMKEGRVIYERVVQLPVRSFNIDPSIAAQIPKSRTDQYELLFANQLALWQYLPNATNEGDGNSITGNGMVFRFASAAGDVSYYDLDKGTRVDQREIMEKSYVVSDSIRKLEWKLSDETKILLNHTVRKATSQRVMT